MEFRIADTFTDSLAKLIGDEQKSVNQNTATDRRRHSAVTAQTWTVGLGRGGRGFGTAPSNSVVP
jgi:hypothetical protein